MKKFVLGIFAAGCLMTSMADAQLPENFQFVHPGVVFNAQDLNRMKDNRNIEPWRTGYQIMLDDRLSSFDYEMQGPAEIVDRNGQNNGIYDDDMDSVFYQSLQFYITGDERYAENAMEIIEAWATTHTTIGGNVPALSAADRGVRMIAGAEILRYYYSGWTSEMTTLTEAYARNVLMPPLYIPDYTRIANQGASQIDAVIPIAAFLNDKELLEQAIDAFLNEDCAGISNTLPNGQVGDSGRDQGHAFGHANNLASAAENAHKQGIDLFSTLNNRVLATSEYWNAYGTGATDEYIPYGTCYDFFHEIRNGSRGGSDYNTNKFLEIIYGAYSVRKGISAPFTTQRINEIPASINTFFYKKSVDTTTSVTIDEPYADHIGTTDNALTNTRVGSNSNGSSNFNSNTWTISSSNGDVYGTDNGDNFQFAYKHMTGNVTIVAQIDSVTSSNSNAKVGLMFRESLNSDSRMLTLWALGDGGIQTSWRGQSVLDEDRADGGALTSFRDIELPALVRVEFNENRVTASYSPDTGIWVPFASGIFNQVDEYYLGLYAASHDSNIATGVFSRTEVLVDESSAFVPNPNSTYYIDSPVHNVRLGANGANEDAFTTSTHTTGVDVEWRFVPNGNGGWHIDRAGGGDLPRLRTDGTESADMQSSDFDSRWETFSITSGAFDNTSFLSVSQGPAGFTRLQITPDGQVNMVPSTFSGSWESFEVTEVSTSPQVVHMKKRNAQGFAIDGNRGAANGQSVYLWSQNSNNVNQQWIEISRGNGYYSYQKQGTDYCLDGGNGGANRQDVYLWECSDNNQNQHWEKVSTDSGFFQLVKRNAPGFALDGGSSGANGQNVQLFDSSSTSHNLQWSID